MTGVREENASYPDDAGPSDFQGGGQDKKSAWLAERFEEHRGRLRAVAYRMLGSLDEADDAVQEAWVRFSAAGADEVVNLGGWLTTIVSRVCLNTLRARAARPETLAGARVPDPVLSPAEGPTPEQEALLADSVGLALLVVLETLTPAERVAFVLHDVFDFPFGEIAPMLDRTPEAARQLASRARHRVRAAGTREPDGAVAAQQAVVSAFFAAARAGNLAALVELLDPDVVLRTDGFAAAPTVLARRRRRVRCRPRRRQPARGVPPGARQRGRRRAGHPARPAGGPDGLYRRRRPDHRGRRHHRPAPPPPPGELAQASPTSGRCGTSPRTSTCRRACAWRATSATPPTCPGRPSRRSSTRSRPRPAGLPRGPRLRRPGARPRHRQARRPALDFDGRCAAAPGQRMAGAYAARLTPAVLGVPWRPGHGEDPWLTARCGIGPADHAVSAESDFIVT